MWSEPTCDFVLELAMQAHGNELANNCNSAERMRTKLQALSCHGHCFLEASGDGVSSRSSLLTFRQHMANKLLDGSTIVLHFVQEAVRESYLQVLPDHAAELMDGQIIWRRRHEQK